MRNEQTSMETLETTVAELEQKRESLLQAIQSLDRKRDAQETRRQNLQCRIVMERIIKEAAIKELTNKTLSNPTILYGRAKQMLNSVEILNLTKDNSKRGGNGEERKREMYEEVWHVRKEFEVERTRLESGLVSKEHVILARKQDLDAINRRLKTAKIASAIPT